MFMTVCPTN